MGFVHVIGGEDPGAAEEFFDEVGVAFEIDKIGGAGEMEGGVRDAGDEGEPFLGIGVAKNGAIRGVFPGVILEDAGVIGVDEVFYFRTLHNGYIVTCGMVVDEGREFW